ncbi:MAG TPA: type II toxin-antitoxin system RelE/ParE family toxin [Thermoanaerobaculia bacterium]
MSARADWAAAALKDLARLDRKLRERVFQAVERLAQSGYGDVRALHGSPGGILRLRVGDWRVLFSRKDTGELLVLRVRPRGDAYRP